jgi:hypothetical protein
LPFTFSLRIPLTSKMTETNADEKMDMASTVVKTPKKKEQEDPPKEEDDDDSDSEDSLPLRKLAAKRKRGKGTPATKVTLGRTKRSPVPSTPEDTSLDFEDEEEPKKGELIRLTIVPWKLS